MEGKYVCVCLSVFVRGHMRGGDTEVPGAPCIVPVYVHNRLFGEASQPVNCSIQTELTGLCLTGA